MEDHTLSAVRDCFFGIFAATINICRLSAVSATWWEAMPLDKRTAQLYDEKWITLNTAMEGGVFIRSWTISCFRKLLKANISYVMPVCQSLCRSIYLFVSLSACLHANIQLSLDNFYKIRYFSVFFSKICCENSTLLKVTTVPSTLHKHVHTFKIIYRWILLRVRHFADEIWREN